MLRHTLIVVLFMLLGGVAPAEEKAPDTAADVPPSVEATAPATEPVATPAPTPAATAKSPDTFVPSEEISEDLSVSFPVDI